MKENIRNLYYYAKFGYDDFRSWAEKDLAQFLFFDFIDDSKKTGGFISLGESSFENIKQSVQKYRKHQFFIDVLDKIFFRLCLRQKELGKEKILFQWIKSPNIILSARQHYSTGLILRGKKERFFAIFNFMGYVALTDLGFYLQKYLTERKIGYLYELLDKIEERLRAINPQYLVLWNDSFPLERSLILVCKKLGICTIDIQPGLYSSYTLLDGKVADYKLVWGEYVKDIFVKQNIRKPEDIYVLGYPYSLGGTRPVYKKNKNYTVCYLGQDYEFFNKELLEIKVDTVKKIADFCNKTGLRFMYRPHSGEDIGLLHKKIPDVFFVPAKEKLIDTIENADIFISFDSTSLVEAALSHKLSLQLLSYPVETDNFERLGACHKTFQKTEELEDYFSNLFRDPESIQKPNWKINNYYMETSYNPGKRFLEILFEIKKKKSNLD